MKKKLVPFLVIILTLFYYSNDYKVTDLLAKSQSLYSKIKIFTSVLETVQRSYIEKRDSDDLLDDAIKGVLSNLDPHTVYLRPSDFQDWNQTFEGYSGIGITFEVIRNKITVMSVMQFSPAATAGIQPGDKILEINDASVIGLKKEDALKYFLGPTGLTIKIKVASDRWRGPKEFNLTRERIVVESVTQVLMLRPEIGYIKIERFTATTSKELDEALNSLESQGMKKLILDLRGNSGGYLNSAIEVSDKFIPEGNLILKTKGRLASSLQEYYATGHSTRELYPLIVLIDHGSASASEIVAGAIQDLDRGLVAGKTSFGKGLVQSQYRFQDGSALLITTARYYTPSGRPIQRGFFDKTKEEYYREAYNDDSRNGKLNSNLAFKTLTGRTVHGGGGIVPDIWIETEKNRLSQLLRALYFSEKRLFFAFIESFIKKLLRIKKEPERFINDFIVPELVFHKFAVFVKRSDPNFSNYDFEQDKADIKFLLKREMAYMLWGSQARFRVNVERDQQLNEAVNHFEEANALLSMVHY